MTPEFSLRILGGNNVTSRVRDRLLSLRITDSIGQQSDFLELVLDDREGKLKTPTPGTQFEVGLGYREDGTLTHHGLFVYDETEFDLASHQLSIRARADDFRSSYKEPKSRSFDNNSLVDILKTIAAEYGYVANIDNSFANTQIGHLDQVWESDMNLVNRLSVMHGAACKVANNELRFFKHSDSENATSATAIILKPKDISQGRVTRIDREKWGAVKAKYHDTNSALPMEEMYGSSKPILTLAKLRANKEEAANAAKAAYENQARSTGKLNLSLAGRGDLKANGVIEMQEWRDGVNGKWLIKRVQHVLDNSGYRCDVEAEVIN